MSGGSRANRNKRRRDPDSGKSAAAIERDAARVAKLEASLEDVAEPDFDVSFADDDGAMRHRYILSRDAKLRLDKYLQNRVKGISRAKIQQLIDLGGVKVNGAGDRIKASTKLKRGDIVDVVLPPKPSDHLEAEDIPLDILFEDDHFLAVNKQANLVVHPARGSLKGTLLNALAYHFQQKEKATPPPTEPHTHAESESQRDEGSGIPNQNENTEPPPDILSRHLSSIGREGNPDRGEGPRPGVVHRLDKNTTGVMVVAKSDEAHWKLSKQFEDKTNLKCYLALVHQTPGCLEEPAGVIEAPLGPHHTIKEAQSVRHDNYGKPSTSIYRVRERYDGYSLVEIEIKTGRTHQIRVHLSYVGCPIVGDLLYGGELVGPPELENPPLPAGHRPMMTYARAKSDGQALEAKAADRLANNDLYMSTPALHATLLGIHHPTKGHWMEFTASVHEPMRSLVNQLRKNSTDSLFIPNNNARIDLNKAVPVSSLDKEDEPEKTVVKPKDFAGVIEVWGSKSECSDTIICPNTDSYIENLTNIRSLEPGTKKKLVFYGDTWEVCMQKYYSYMGLGEYKPVND